MVLFVFIKKEKLTKGLVMVCLLFGLVCCGVFHEKESVKTTAEAEKVIIIDPGHGGFDGGASANGVTEKDINLKVALYLKEELEKNGFLVQMTREGDVSTAPDSSQKGAKTADLKARKALQNPETALAFVSVHMNKFEQAKYHGAQVFYAQDDKSKRLGETLQAALKAHVDAENERQAKKTDGNIFLLKDVAVPSVVVECGFLSNEAEAAKLQTEEYQRKLAEGICRGLMDYFAASVEE